MNAKRKLGTKRIAAGWTLLGLAALLGVVWFASRWWGLSVPVGSDDYVQVAAGTVTLCRDSQAPTPSGVERHNAARWDFWTRWKTADGGMVCERSYGVVSFWRFGPGPVSMTLTGVLFWPVPLLMLGAGAPLLLSGRAARRRAMTGMCAACGYSLAGIAGDAPCPECGKAPAVTRS